VSLECIGHFASFRKSLHFSSLEAVTERFWSEKYICGSKLFQFERLEPENLPFSVDFLGIGILDIRKVKKPLNKITIFFVKGRQLEMLKHAIKKLGSKIVF
jgi:hypothetical protein